MWRIYFANIYFSNLQNNFIQTIFRMLHKNASGSAVVAQLVERSLPTPKITSSNPIVGKLHLLSTALKTKIK